MKSNEFVLEEWVAGFVDGEGGISIGIVKEENMSIGYSMYTDIDMKQTSPSYIAGLFDAEGYVTQQINENQTDGISYYQRPIGEISMNGESTVNVMKALKIFCDDKNIECSIREIEATGENRNDGLRFRVNSLDNTEKFLKEIYPHAIEKKKQMTIILEQIIPRMREKKHLEKEGFLEIMTWVDLMNSLKGGNRGDYNLEYFEQEWGIELSEEKKPNIDSWGNRNKYEKYSGSKNIKDW